MKYVADDGKEFDTERECRAYEDQKKINDADREAAYAAVQEAEKLYEDARDNYYEALKNYRTKYCTQQFDKNTFYKMLALVLG